MTDDQWRRDRDDPNHDNDDDDFGAVRFADDEADPADGGLSFGGAETGPMPSWSNAPAPSADDDLDVWSSFSSKNEEDDPFMEDDFSQPRPARIQIGSDPSADSSRPTERPEYDDEPAPRQRTERPPSYSRTRASSGRSGGGVGRDMPMAIGVGLLLGAIFVLLIMFAPVWTIVVFAGVVVLLGAYEFYDKIEERGYQPVAVMGILAAASGPLVAYWAGETGLPLVVAFAFIGSAIVFVFSTGLHSGPLPNMAVTNLGVVYLGLLGGFAGLILKFSTVNLGVPGKNAGTDTLMLVAIGVVASDVGALFVGSAAGRTPLRAWISPNKTVEGFIGGLLVCVIAITVASLYSDTWNGQVNVLVLGVGIGVLVPIGDLTESMFKRNLDIKDFGTIVRGHGGVLDRFDGFLFALPFAYYALITLEPWTYVK